MKIISKNRSSVDLTSHLVMRALFVKTFLEFKGIGKIKIETIFVWLNDWSITKLIPCQPKMHKKHKRNIKNKKL